MDHTENPALARRRPSWSALGAKLGRILQPGNEQPDDAYSSLPDDTDLPSLRKIPSPRMVEEGRRGDSDDASNLTSSTSNRSVSRGREGFQSSGRGGAGNIRRPSLDPGSPAPPLEPLSPVRGREPHVDPERAQTTGRGGVGNIRSGSRARSMAKIPSNLPQTASLMSDQAANVSEYEKQVIQLAEEAARTRAKSSGRGGLGNISSRSRSRGPTALRLTGPSIHSTGRGGAGNLQPGSAIEAELIGEILEAEDRARTSHEEGIHSTGRGGRANLTSVPSPPPEQLSLHNQAFESTGRGGVGNLLRSRSASREAANNSRSRSASLGGSKDRGSSLARILSKVTLQPSQSRDGQPPLDGEGRVQE